MPRTVTSLNATLKGITHESATTIRDGGRKYDRYGGYPPKLPGSHPCGFPAGRRTFLRCSMGWWKEGVSPPAVLVSSSSREGREEDRSSAHTARTAKAVMASG